MSIKTDIYALSNGQIDLSGVNGPSDLSSEIFQRTGQYAAHGSSTEENSFHDTNRRINRAMAVMSLVCTDSTIYQESSSYQKLMRDHDTSFLLQYGAFGAQDANAQLSLRTEKLTFDRSAGSTAPVQLGKLSFDERHQLAETGSFTRGSDIFRASAGSNLQELARQAEIQESQMDRILKAGSRKDQSTMMAEMRHNSLQQLKGQHTELAHYDGTRKSFHHIMHDKSISQGAKDALRDHQKLFGNTDHEAGNSNFRNSQAYGRRVVASHLMGSDFQQGVTFYRSAGKTIKMAGGITATLGSNVLNVSMRSAGRIANACGQTGISNWTNTRLQNSKAKKQRKKEIKHAKRTGNIREYRKQLREDRSLERIGKRKQRESKYQAKIQKKIDRHRAAGNTEKVKRLQARRNRHTRRKDFLANNKLTKGFQNIAARFTRLQERIQALQKLWSNSLLGKLLHAPSAIMQLFNNIKKALFKILLIIVGGYLVLVLIISGAGCLLSVIFSFFSSEKAMSLGELLSHYNYVQNIVDDTTQNLEKRYLELAEQDAYHHFVKEDPIASGNVEWYKEVTEAEIGLMTDENGKDMPGISNIIPITSIMHYRMVEDLNYKHYYNAKAYEYYLWVQTHHIGSCDGSHPDYEYIDVTTECPSVDDCTNLYKHGYDISLAPQQNAAKLEAAKIVLFLLGNHYDLSEIQMQLLPEITVEKLPQDAVSICDHYEARQYGSTIEGGGYDLPISEKVKCGIEEHEHSEDAGCYQVSCGHTHDASCGFLGKDCTHECNDDCEKELTCTKPEHIHEPWESEANPGCFKTEYECLGHCGGHITPVVNLWAEYEYENIIQYDNFKTTYWMTEADFSEDWMSKLFLTRSLKDWYEYWNKKMMQWFSPFPGSPQRFLDCISKNAFNLFVEIQQWGMNLTRGVLTGDFESHEKEDAFVIEESDVFGFDGYYDENGNLKQGHINNLNDIYGTYETDWKEGVEIWEDFEVIFPVNGCYAVSSRQQEKILQTLMANYGDNLTPERQAFLEQLMSMCGKFTYDIKNPANMTAESGRIDCSGYIASGLYHSIGRTADQDWTSSGFAQNGHEWNHQMGDLKPGDILAYNASSSYAGGSWQGGTTNHTAAYVGYLDEETAAGIKGSSGAGYYILDCSSSTGGATLRRVNNLNSFNYVYNECFE